MAGLADEVRFRGKSGSRRRPVRLPSLTRTGRWGPSATVCAWLEGTRDDPIPAQSPRSSHVYEMKPCLFDRSQGLAA